MIEENQEVQAPKKIDPLYDLIMNEQLQKNEWPKELDQIKSGTGSQSLMAKTMSKELF